MRVSQVEAEKTAEKQRKIDLKASLYHAIKMDIRSLQVPKEGTYEEVWDNCRWKQMPTLQGIIKIAGQEALMMLNGNPDAEITRRIALARPDLAFYAGISFCLIASCTGAVEMAEDMFRLDSDEVLLLDWGKPNLMGMM